MPDKKCPNCGLSNTSSALHCVCGYNFETSIIDGTIFCPQCGTVNQNKAGACQKCGFLLKGIDESTNTSKLGSFSRMETVVNNSRNSFWMGILAIIPYLCAILSTVYYDLFPVTPTTSHWVKLAPRIIFFYPALLGLVSGIPFGLAAIITGIIGYLKQPRIKKNVVAAVVGILFGVGGIAGHLWYIWIVATCQFCQ